MEEQTQQTTEVRKTYFDRDRYSALSRAIWRDFGPLIMGALVLLLVLGGGWYLWNKSKSAENEPVVVVEENTGNGSEVSLPTSEITIPGLASPRPSASPSAAVGVNPSPSPVVSPKPSPSPATGSAQANANVGKGNLQVATGSALTKGGQLPQTGPEAGLVLLFTSLTGAGFALHKLAKRI